MQQVTLAGLTVFTVLVAACGGGGDDADPRHSYPTNITYHESGGLRWSAATSHEVKNPQGLGISLEQTAQSYCTQQTCDADGRTNCRWTNFNGEPGWRVASLNELRALYARTPQPPGWVIGRVWSSSGAQGVNFANGQTFFDSGVNSKAMVSCVKPV